MTLSFVHVKLFRRFISYMFSLQLFFVLYGSILLQNQIQGKPYGESQALDDTEQWFTNEQRESNQAVQIETSRFLQKRDVGEYNMTDLCQRPDFPLSPSCVKGTYSCHGHIEYVCEPLSFHCLSSKVVQLGFPKCVGEYEFVKINLGREGLVKVRRTKNCKCA